MTTKRQRPPTRARDARADDAVRVLVVALRRRVDDGRFDVDIATSTALQQLLRAGGPGAPLGPADRATLRVAVAALARPFATTGPMPRALLAFARDAVQAALALHRAPRHPGASVSQRIDDGAAALARAAVWAEAGRARDNDDLVRRAVTRALREKKRGRRGHVPLDVEEGDPLRAVLQLPSRGRVWLPKNDLRARIVESARGSAFGAALQHAARFAEEPMRSALGEELWALARPVGFADHAETRVLVEVASSAAAHEAQLRSREFVGTLRALPGLERVKGIKVLVVSTEPAPRQRRQ
ncbi:MAG: DUF721 domain-containing protein [Deltaproteobacteria bacterium]|nr:DUF721 domain-containing protein [Deltaproteobacteria bacterium]